MNSAECRSDLRILLFAQGTAGATRRSGIQRVTIELTKHLAAYSVVELVKWDSFSGQLQFFTDADLKVLFGNERLSDGIAVHRQGQNISDRFGAKFDPSVRYWLIFPEIAYRTAGSNEIYTRVVAQCREHGIGVASVFYDLIPIANEHYSFYREAHVDYVCELVRSDVIIPISRHSEAALRDYYGARIDPADWPFVDGKIRTIRLPEGARIVSTDQAAHNQNTILLVGMVESRKRQVEVLQTWNELVRGRPELGRLRLLVIGALHPDSAVSFRQVMQANPNIAHHDYGTEEFIADCYRKALFTVFASNDEGYGLPIAESLARGVPCLTANFGAMAEVAEGGGCLTVDVNDPAALKAGLLRMALDSDLRAQLRHEIAARDMRTWTDYAQDVLNTLQEVDHQRGEKSGVSESQNATRERYAAEERVERALADRSAEEAWRLKRDADSLRAELVAERARAAQAAAAAQVQQKTLDAITQSTSWHFTAGARHLAGKFPRVARLARGSLKLLWWTLSLQLISRLKSHLQQRRNNQEFVAPDIPRQAAVSSEPGVSGTLIGVEAKVQDRGNRADTRAISPASPHRKFSIDFLKSRRVTKISDAQKCAIFIDLTQGAEGAVVSVPESGLLKEARVCRSGEPVAAFAEAVESARAEQRHLLVLIGTTVDTDIPGRLSAIFEADPMVGFAVPRFLDPEGDGILPLPSLVPEKLVPGYNRAILKHLPTLQLVPEFVTACVLIRRELVANFPPVERQFTTVSGALFELMTWSRRRGFRVAIANHITAAYPTSGIAYPAPTFEEHSLLEQRYPDLSRAEAHFANLSCHRREALLGLALSSRRAEARRLLLDCRGLHERFNGTTECILGYLSGLSRIDTDWSVTILTTAAAASFHDLAARYPSFKIVSDLSDSLCTVAVRLLQPWYLQDLIDLHEHALFVVVNMLDTIGWDILMEDNLDSVWSFTAKNLDGLLFISNFTRDRFAVRFSSAPGVRQAVIHLSCDYDDYAIKLPKNDAAKGHILLIGNDFDHKGIAQAINCLAGVFPQERFVVIGCEGAPHPNVKYLSSGSIPETEVNGLYAGARMLVFPSFYEGFGFPIIKGLSCGLDVVARRSALLEEVAAMCRPKGRVVPFDDPDSLIDAVGRILIDESVAVLQLGSAMGTGESPQNWRDTAAGMLEFIEGLTTEISPRQYDARESVIRLITK